VAARLTAVLGEAQQLLSKDEQLSKLVQYRVKERGANEKARLQKVLQYQGPDPDTIAVLRDHHDQWLFDPAQFWVRPLPVVANSMGHSIGPQENILICYLQTMRDDA